MIRRKFMSAHYVNNDGPSDIADYSVVPLHFLALEDGMTVTFTNTVQYSIDECSTWSTLNKGVASPAVSKYNRIYFKGTLDLDGTEDDTHQLRSDGIGNFQTSKTCEVAGNAMSLLYGDNFIGEDDLTGRRFIFYMLFSKNANLISAQNLILPARILAEECYANMFNSCSNLVTPPVLPATTLGEQCYRRMFYDCDALETAPELPATTLTYKCYKMMFWSCKSLKAAPELPATTLADACYLEMFAGCRSITEIPELPATTLAEQCYNGMFASTGISVVPELNYDVLKPWCFAHMFSGCDGITEAIIPKNKILADHCYYGMFEGCQNITEMPELPATTLAPYCYRYMFARTGISEVVLPTNVELVNGCYYGMFEGCQNITEMPELPATTLAPYCYAYMFCDCTNLTTASELPATTLAKSCYDYMFCSTALITAPALPATTLAEQCYNGMFDGCTALTTAPELLADTLESCSYAYMFYGCESLNYIKMTATRAIDWDGEYSNNLTYDSTDALEDWCYNVSDTGTFVKHKDSIMDIDSYGIPPGWDIIEVDDSNSGGDESEFAPGTVFNFEHDYSNPAVQEISLPAGRYKLECWGADGGDCYDVAWIDDVAATGGKGGYAQGTLTLTEPTTLYIYVGGAGGYTYGPDEEYTNIVGGYIPGGWNGGGSATYHCTYNDDGESWPTGGGGATDICLIPSNVSTDTYQRTIRTTQSYQSRFIIAGGGGGSSMARIDGDIVYTNVEGGVNPDIHAVITTPRTLSNGAGSYQSKSNYNYCSGGGGAGAVGGSIEYDNYDNTNILAIQNAKGGSCYVHTNASTVSCTGLILDDGYCASYGTSGYVRNPEYDKGYLGGWAGYARITVIEANGDLGDTPETPDTPPTTKSYTVSGNWIKSSTVDNPNPSQFDGVYESTNTGSHNSYSVAIIDINGYDSFQIYIRSWAESNYDYVMASQPDVSITNNTSYSSSDVKAHTRGNQNSTEYTLVTYTGLGGTNHTIRVIYRKDGSENENDDKGYLLIPKNQ